MGPDIEKFFNLSLDMLCIADIDGYFKLINPAFRRTLGWSEAELLSRPFVEFIHPDDAPATLRELERLSSGIPTISFENRYRCADGGYKHLQWTSYPEEGTGLLYAVGRDITELKQSQERFELAIESAPSAMILVDDRGKIVLVNRETERLFGYERGELLRQSIEILVPEPLRDHHADLRRLFSEDPQPRPMGQTRDLAAVRKDGSGFPAEIGLNPIHTSEETFVLSVVVDLTERKQIEQKILDQARQLEDANRKLVKLATTDSLTNLKNRRALFDQIDVLLKISQRTGRSLSLLMVDIDHFKDYNDRFGHPAGDEVLKGIAQVLSDTARRSDIVARYGGEEFAIVLPETSQQGALKSGERFRDAVARSPWPHREVTVSVGASTADLTENGKLNVPRLTSRLIAEADNALYYSKERGRNRVTHRRDVARNP